MSVKITGDGDEALTLSSKTNENYTITVKLTGSGVAVATVTAVSAFGAKHGLESLAQMVKYHNTCHDGARAAYCYFFVGCEQHRVCSHNSMINAREL